MYLVIRKNSIILTLFICFIAVFSIFCINKATLMAKSDNTNWGLSFKKTGETPVGNASPEFLKITIHIILVIQSKKYIFNI